MNRSLCGGACEPRPGYDVEASCELAGLAAPFPHISAKLLTQVVDPRAQRGALRVDPCAQRGALRLDTSTQRGALRVDARTQVGTLRVDWSPERREPAVYPAQPREQRGGQHAERRGHQAD